MLSKKINRILKIVTSAKISIKLTALYAIMFSLVLLLLNASILFGVKYYLYKQVSNQIEDIQNVTIDKLSIQDGSINISDETLFIDIPSKENTSLKITTEDGEILTSIGELKYSVKESHNNEKNSGNKVNFFENKDSHIGYKYLTFENDKTGVLHIEIAKSMTSEYIFMNILFVVMAIADFLGVIISIILGYIVSKHMLKPIDNITKTAENISVNNLKERIDVKGPDDELKRLANTFNGMIDRLQEAFTRQTEFVSDASHELRTPIAIIQGYANLLDRWGKDDRDALEKAIHGIKIEAANMADLIEKLLFLAKGDSGVHLLEKKAFLLNELIDDVVNESKLIEKNHKISSNRNDIVKISADYKMIKQMLRIFIDNSIKFTPIGGSIDISSEIQGNTVKLTVSDTGIGLPKDELKNIFDRFYIVDKSRSKDNGGTGLGLSIAKWISDMHNGTIEINSEEGKWTKISVILNLEK